MKYNRSHATAAWGQMAKDREQGLDYRRLSLERAQNTVRFAGLGAVLCFNFDSMVIGDHDELVLLRPRADRMDDVDIGGVGHGRRHFEERAELQGEGNRAAGFRGCEIGRRGTVRTGARS